MLKRKKNLVLIISSLVLITAVIIFSIFVSRTHTYVNVGDKLEVSSYDYDNRKSFESSYLDFDWDNADTTNKTVAFKGIKNDPALFTKANGDFVYDTLEIPSDVLYAGSDDSYTGLHFTVTKIKKPTVSSADMNSTAGCFTYDLVKGLIIPKSVTEIETSAFLPFVRIEYLEVPFIGTERGIASDSDKPLGSMFSHSCTYYSNPNDSTIPDTSKYTSQVSDEIYTRTIDGVTYSNKNSISRWFPQSMTNLTVAYLFPEKLTTVVVTDDTLLPDRAFLELKTVKSITLSDTLTNLNSVEGVCHCLELEEIHLPKNVTVLGEKFLSDCKKLTEVTLPDGLIETSNGLLSRCTLLKTINIPASIRKINSQTFLGCTLLDTIRVFTTNSETHEIISYINQTGFALPAGIEEIYSESFSGTRFDSIVISSMSLKFIEEGAFKACNYLQTLTLPFIGYERGNSGCKEAMLGYVFGSGSVQQKYGSESNEVYPAQIPSTLKTVTITSETVVARGSMSNLPNVQTILINPYGGASQKIEVGAFEKNKALDDLSVPFVGNNQDGNRFCTIFGTEGYTGGYLAQGYYVPTSLKKIRVTNMPRIRTGAFSDMTSVTDVEISAVTTFCEQAIFYNNVNLKNLTIPFAGKFRGEEYYWWSWHGNYERQNSIGWIFSQSTSSDEYALGILRYSSGDKYTRWIPNTLKSITITDETYIGPYVFQGLKSLETITISNDGTGNIPSGISEGTMWGCSNLTTLNIPYIGANANTTGKSDRAFTIGWYFGTGNYDNSYVAYQYSNYRIPNNLSIVTVLASDKVSIKVIPGYSFANMKSLETFSTTANVTTLADHAFYNDLNLNNVSTDNATYTKVGDYAFANCSKVNAIYESEDKYFVPKTVDTIGAYAFSGTAISEVDFSTSAIYKLKHVGAYAFDSCSKISSITIPGVGGSFYTLQTLGEGAFANCDTLATVSLGPNAYSKYLLKNCSSVTSIDLTDVVTFVPEGMFYGCTSLSDLKLDPATTEIGRYAFYNCESLTSFDIKATITKIGSYAFTNCSGIDHMLMPRTVKTIEPSGFYGCDREKFYFYVLDPESEWPVGWVNNWNCDYPVYIYGEVDEGIFEYQYVSDLRGYEIINVTKDDYFIGTLHLPSTYNGVRVVSIAENVLKNQPRVTSVIVPSTVRRIKGQATHTGSGVQTTGGLNNGNIITVYFDISKAKALNPGKYYKDTDSEEATGADIPQLFNSENNWFNYGFVYYNDYWGYTADGKARVPYLKLNQLIYGIDVEKDGKLFYDGTLQTIDVTSVKTKAQVIDSGNIIVESTEYDSFPTATGLTPYLPVNLFNFAYSNNINASTKALITATVNINELTIYNNDIINIAKPATSIYGVDGQPIAVNVINKEALTEKLYLGGTGTRNFTINKKQITVFGGENRNYKATYGTPWRWENWTNDYVDGFDSTDFVLTGVLTTKGEDVGTYESVLFPSSPSEMGDFEWYRDPVIRLNGVNVTDNFDIIVGNYAILKVEIFPLDVTVSWTGGKWANDTTDYYTDYNNSLIDDFYLWEYTGEVIEPKAKALVASVDTAENPVLGREIEDILTVENGSQGYGYGVLDQVLPNYPATVTTKGECTSSATAYLAPSAKKNYRLVYFDLDTNKWTEVEEHLATGNREVVVRYAVMKKKLTINIENNNYLIGYDDDYWMNSTWPGADMTITGLNEGSFFAGDLRTYYYKNNGTGDVLQSYTDSGDYYLKQVNSYKEHTNSTYNNPLKYIDWVPQTFSYDPAYNATALDYMIYRYVADDDNGPVYKCENDYYDLNLVAHINVKYNEFVQEVYIDGTKYPVVDETLIGNDTYNIIEYHTEGKPHQFKVNVANEGITLNDSNIVYSYNSSTQPSATYYEFRALNADGYQVGATINRKNFYESHQNYLIRVLKSDYKFAPLDKEYDGNPVEPNAIRKPTLDKYADVSAIEHYYDEGAKDSLDSLTFTYYKCATKSQASEINKLASAPYEIAKYVVHITADGSDYFNDYDDWIEFEITKRTIVINLGNSFKYYDGNVHTIQYTLTNSDNYKILDGHKFVGSIQTLSSAPGIYYGTGTHLDDEGNTINDVYTQYWFWKNNNWKVYTIDDNTDVTKFYNIEVVGQFEIKKRVIYEYDPLFPDLESVESYGAPDADYNPSGWDGLYDGLPHTITVILHNLPSTATVYYTEEEVHNAEGDEGIHWTTFNIQKMVPGNYTIYYKVVIPNYDSYYGYEHINIEKQIIEYTEGNYIFEYDGNWHPFEVTVQYPLSAVVEYSTNGTSWQTNLFEFRDYMDDSNPKFVRIYYRITAENFESVGLNNDKFVDFSISQEGFNEMSGSEFSITGYDEFYDGASHGLTITKNDSSIYNEKIYYSLTCLPDLSTWQLTPITFTNYTTSAVTVYVRIVDAKDSSNKRYKDTYGPEYSATINIKPLNFDQISITDYDEVYDGNDHTVTINGLNYYENVNYTIFYSKDPNSQSSGSGWTTTPIKFKNASTTSNIIYIKIEAPNFITYYGQGQVRITTVKLRGVIGDGNTSQEPLKIEYTAEPVAYSSIIVNTLNDDNSITEGMIHDGTKTYTFYGVTKNDGYWDPNDASIWVDEVSYESDNQVISRPTKLGIYCVRITYKNTTNCTGKDELGNAQTMVVYGFFEIVAKEVKVTYQKSQQYTGKALSPNFEVSTGTKDTLTLNIQLVSHPSLAANQVIEIDTYYYKVSINEDTDLYVLPEEFNDLIKFEITKRQVSVYIDTTSIYSYNSVTGEGNPWSKDSGYNYQGWNEFMSGSLITGHVLDLAMETSSYVRATYAYPMQSLSQNAIIVTKMDILDSNNGYVSVLDKYDLTVQAIVKIVFESKTHNFKDKEIYYDGEEHGITLSVDDNEIINPIITFTTDDLTGMTDDEKKYADWSLYSPKFTAAGEYVINVRIQSDNLEDIYTTAKLIIKKTKLQVKIDAFDLIYDATEHVVTSKVINISSKVSGAIQPKAIKYYDSSLYTKSQINAAFKVSEYAKIDEYLFNKGIDKCIDAATYFAVVIYEGSDDYEYGYFVEEVTIEKKDIKVKLGADNILNTKNYDGKVMYQVLTGATINTSDLITGHEAKSGNELKKFRIKTNSSYAGVYESHVINNSGLTRAQKNELKDFEFHDAFLITDSDNDDADVTRNYHPVIVTGITYVINKITFTFSVAEETIKVYATEESDEISADYVINGYKAVLASPNMILPNKLNPSYYFDNEPIYTWYKLNDDSTIGQYLGSSNIGDRITDVGDYYVFVTFAEGTNFEAYNNMDKHGIVHITPLAVDVEWSNLEQDFTGSPLQPTATYVDPFDRTIGLNVSILENMIPVDAVTPAGTYSAYASFMDTDIDSKNYQISSTTSNSAFKINKLTFTYNVDATTYNNQTDWIKEISKEDFEDFPSNLQLVGSETPKATLRTKGHEVGAYYYGEANDKQLVFDYKVLDSNNEDLTSSIELIASGSVVIYTEEIKFEAEDVVVAYDGNYHTVLEGIKVLNPANENYYKIYVKKITEQNYTGSPTDDEYSFINVGSHKIDFMITSTISGTEKTATGSITITIKQIEADAMIKGDIGGVYTGLPVSNTIVVEGSYNKHPDGTLIYTYYRTDSTYSNPILITDLDGKAPKNIGYYMVEITNSADSIPESESYIKNYTDLKISKTFEIKPRKINYSYEGNQIVLNKSLADSYPLYKNGFEGSIIENDTWTYNPAALVDSSINLAGNDELHIKLQSNNNGASIIRKLFTYSGAMPYSGDTTAATAQMFYSDETVTDYFSLIWYVLDSDGKNVSYNYEFNFDFLLDIHYPDLDPNLHTITPTYAPKAKGTYDPSVYHYATITFDSKIVTPSMVTQSYSHQAIDSGASKSNISEMKFKDPGVYSVGYTLSCDGYREYHGQYIIDISYTERQLTDSFNNKKDELTKVYDGTPVTITDIIGLNGANLKWYYGDEGVFKPGSYSDNILDSDVTIKFKKENLEATSIQEAGQYSYTITVPSTTYYVETVIEGQFIITKANITITDRDPYYTTGYTGGNAFHTVTENDPYYMVTLNGNPLPSGFQFKGTLQTKDNAVGTYEAIKGQIVPVTNYVITGGSSNYSVTLNMTMQILPGVIVATTSNVTAPYSVETTYALATNVTSANFKPYVYYVKNGTNYIIASQYNSNATYYERVDGAPVTRYPNITFITPSETKITRVLYALEGTEDWQEEPIGVSLPGSKIIKMKISADNFEDFTLKSTVTITKADTTIYIPSMTREYNGQPALLPRDLRIDSDVTRDVAQVRYEILMDDGLWYDMGLNQLPVNVGTYKIIVEIPETASNLYHGIEASKEFEIIKKTVTVEWYKDASYVDAVEKPAIEFTYDGFVHIPAAVLKTGIVIDGEVFTPNYSVNVTTFEDTTTVVSKPWLADIYVATVKIDDDANWDFNPGEMSYTYAIKKRKITLYILGSNMVYDGTVPEFSYTEDTTVTPANAYYYATNMPSYEVNGAVKYDYFDSYSILQTVSKNVAIYTADSDKSFGTDFEWKNGFEIWNLSFDSGNNTEVTDCYVIEYDLSFTIGYDMIKWSAANKELVYDGMSHYLDFVIDNPEPATIYYWDGQGYNIASTYENGEYKLGEIRDGINSFKNVHYENDAVAPYEVKFKIVIQNYQAVEATKTVLIKPKPANLYLKNKVLDHEYDGYNIYDSASEVYLKPSDFDYIDSSNNPRTITLSYEKYDINNGWIPTKDTANVGKYKVIAVLDKGNNSNYEGGTKEYEFEVTRRTITITTLDNSSNLVTKQKTYDGLSLTHPVNTDTDVLNIVPGETFTGTVKSRYAYVNIYQNQDDFEWVNGYKITKTVIVNNQATEVDVTDNYIVNFRLRFNILSAPITVEVTNLEAVKDDEENQIYIDGKPKMAVLGSVGGNNKYSINLSVTGPVLYTVVYEYIDEDTNVNTKKTSNPKFKKQGEHTVKYTVSADNYITVTGEALIVIKGLETGGGFIDYLPVITYNNTPYMSQTLNGKPVYISDSQGTQTITYYKENGDPTPCPTDAGNYYFAIHVDEWEDYEEYTTKKTLFQIEKITREVEWEDYEVTYNGEDQTPKAYILAYDNNTKLYLDVFGTYTDSNVIGYEVSAAFASSDPNKANYTITNFNRSNLFKIYPIEIEKPSISTSLEFIYSETYTLYDIDGNPVCEKDEFDKDIYNEVLDSFNPELTYYTYDDVNDTYIKCNNLNEFENGVTYYLPQFKVFRFGDEVKVKDTSGNVYVIDEDGFITGIIDSNDESIILPAPENASLYKIEISENRDSDEIMASGVKHVFTVSLVDDKNYVWSNTNYDDYTSATYDDAYEIPFKIKRFDISNNVEGLKVEVVSEYKYYIMDIPQEIIPNAEVRLVTSDGLFIRTISSGRVNKYEAYLVDLDNKVLSQDDYNVLGKINAKGMSNINFDVTGTYEKRKTPPVLYELKDNTIRRFVEITVDNVTKNVVKNTGNDYGVERNETSSTIYLGRIHQGTKIVDILNDFKNDNSFMEVYDQNGTLVNPSQYTTKNFGTGFKIVLYSDTEHKDKIDEITGIVFGDLNGDGLIDGRDLLAEKNMITGSVSYDDNPSGYIAGSIGENKTPNGKGLLSLKNYISSEVDFNSNYQVTPEELYA